MNHNEAKFEQLQRYYALWREENAMYDDWAREQGLSSNGALILYALYEAKENCTQKSISQMWSIPKQTVNTILVLVFFGIADLLKDILLLFLTQGSGITTGTKSKERNS